LGNGIAGGLDNWTIVDLNKLLMAVKCRRPASLQLLGATAAAGRGKADGHDRNESAGARAHSFVVDAAAHRTAETFMEGHGTGADRGQAGYGQAMYYSLSLPVSNVIIGCDSSAEQNVQLARELSPRNRQQLAALTEKAQPVSKQSLFFRFYERA
jgi:hypothetical protein